MFTIGVAYCKHLGQAEQLLQNRVMVILSHLEAITGRSYCRLHRRDGCALDRAHLLRAFSNVS
jgi:hypothetical protein